jgi:TRAP-type C4-dicarboxylate transport system permease small subunit
MGKWLQTLCNGIAKFADWASIVLLVFITFQLTIVVILRYFFFANIRWFEQSSVILFFYLVFIPAGLLSRAGQHLNVEVLWEYLQKHEKKKALWLLYIAQRAIEILFCAIALYFSWAYTCHLIDVEATFDFEFFGRRVPQWTTAFAFIIGFFFLVLHTLEVFIASLIKKKV